MIKNIKYIPIGSDYQFETLAWTFDFDFDFDIMSEINSKDCHRTSIDSMLPIPDRYSYDYSESTKLADFLQEWQYSIISILENIFYENETLKIFKSRWPIKKENFSNAVYPHTAIFQDPPGFNMGPHLDNQSVIANVIINLKDNDYGTSFHNYKQHNEILYRASGKANTGVIFLNTPGSLHSVCNELDSDRYILYSSILIKAGWY